MTEGAAQSLLRKEAVSKANRRVWGQQLQDMGLFAPVHISGDELRTNLWVHEQEMTIPFFEPMMSW